MLSLNNKQWKNWSEIFINRPKEIFYPQNEDDLVKIINQSKQGGKKISVIGAGHSFITTISFRNDKNRLRE